MTFVLYGIATVVRMRRQELKLPLWFVSNRSRIPVEKLKRIEAGYVDPDILTFMNLAQSLNSPCGELMDLAHLLQTMSSISEYRLKSRLKSRVQMDRIAQQNERLLDQLAKIERQRACIASDRGAPLDASVTAEIRHRIKVNMKRVETTREHQDERETFLIRSLRIHPRLKHADVGHEV